MAKQSIGTASLILNATYGRMRSGLTAAMGFAQGWANKLRHSFAGGLVLGAAGAGTGSIAATFGEIGGRIDAAAKSAKALGSSTDSILGLQHAAELSGVSAEILEASLRKLRTQVEGPLDDALFDLADRLAAIDDPGERAAVAMESLGRGGIAMTNMLGDGSEALRGMVAEAKELGLAVGDETAAKFETANDAMTRVKTAVQGLTTRILAALAPAIEKIADLFTTVVRKASPLVEVVGEMLGQYWSLIAAILAEIVTLAIELVEQVYQWVGGVSEGASATELVDKVLRGVVKTVATIAIYGWQFVKVLGAAGAMIVGTILEGLDEVKESLAEIIRFMTGIQGKLGEKLFGVNFSEELAKLVEGGALGRAGKDLQQRSADIYNSLGDVNEQLAGIDQWLDRVLSKKDSLAKPTRVNLTRGTDPGSGTDFSPLSGALIRGTSAEVSARLRFDNPGVRVMQDQLREQKITNQKLDDLGEVLRDRPILFLEEI